MELDEMEVRKCLPMIFVKAANLIGIKDPISDINKIEIREMILARFKGLSLEEIHYAFKLEREEVFGERVKHIQLFNGEYVASVLNKYKEWLRKARFHNNTLRKKEKAPEVTSSEKLELKIKFIVDAFNHYKENKNIPFGFYRAYKTLRDYEIIMPPNKEQIIDTRNRASKRCKPFNSSKTKRGAKLKSLGESITELFGGEKTIEIHCEEISLEDFFKTFIDEKKDFKGYIEMMITE